MSYRAGLVGAGRIGQIHADMYRRNEEIDLAAVAELDRDLLDERASAWGIDEEHRYSEHEGMLDSENLNVLSVATPSAFHYEPVVQAAESLAGSGVIFCEKPLANSPERAYEMALRCEEAGVELVVDHTLRFSEAFRSLRRLLHDDRILGDVQSVQIHASGTLMRLGTHYVDLLCYLLDAEPVSVQGGYLVADPDVSEGFDDCNGAATLVFDDGLVAMLDETRSSSVANSIQLVGTDGMIRGQGSDTSSIYSNSFEWRYWTVGNREHVEAPLPATLEKQWKRDMSENTTGFENDAGMYAAQRMFDRVAAHLTALLNEEEPNKSPGWMGATVVETLAAIFVSSDTGSHIDLPLSDRLRSVEIRSQ
jgi:myo-inositol 2-dehydrogenase/D-chiro-inositol 1-dehydrogenase